MSFRRPTMGGYFRAPFRPPFKAFWIAGALWVAIFLVLGWVL